ncbi:MAG: DUF2141 domain-containing protein [Desulfofustis sp. PB-SRB1]|jgi:uncharacterized protein (DUF2141 family)|nr:DUF2141 domain-containing protein [Desulfofustis sp. PB-SRB1]MBM1004136.1 DUF2141 domain-containing protein [Desulfofustis sp. PB-SRB1]
MKKLLHMTIAGSLIMALTPAHALAKELTVSITAIQKERPGQIMVMLFGKQGFPKDHGQAIEIQTKKTENGTATMTFRFTVEIEEFAFKVLHDEDMDGQVGKNWTGIIPAEGLGFSGGAKLGLTGPPSFKRAKLSLAEIEDAIEIPIIYP